ncbi:tetratricopeptide repeat protein [Croceitalea sp. MTPC9]|uniref:tetratricopeptide repeat protein n=1 Tax=unclassified Croceitalea TaxID=2632280 RepID=UPI002B3EC08D|nr:tetratricopeptide repeat protein [Croceitalea sp. MTPC6]GMN16763.1 tetratricopeptide repeat protein [Croceitalea sp. MTPC9]
MNRIKVIVSLSIFSFCVVQAQEEDKKAQREAEKALRESKNITYEANENLVQNDFVNAEAEYRRAISKSPENIAAPYNLGRAYYNRESFSEAFGNFKKAGEKADSKAEKHKAYHNMGNVFMKNKEYEKAVEAYKEALRNNPTDEETRYNLALAKEMLKKQQDEQKNDQNKDDKNEDKKEDQNKDQNQEGDNKEDKEGDQKDDQNKDDGEDGDKGEKKPEENKEGDGDEKKEQKQKPNEGDKPEEKKKPRPNQLSKQQIQNLLEAMQNEEKKVQEKIDAKKVRGAKIKNEKDW